LNLGDLYGLYDDAGAEALVYISLESSFWFPTGSFDYNYYDINQCKYCASKMRFVNVDNSVLEDVPAWRKAADLRLQLNPPTNNVYRALFVSPVWITLMQFILPVLALWTSLEAITEIVRIIRTSSSSNNGSAERESRIISLTVCLLEAPCMFIVGVAFAAGLYGPYRLPTPVCNIAFGLFNGVGSFATFLISSHLREEARVIRTFGADRRTLWAHSRGALVVCAFFTAIPDLAGCLLTASDWFSRDRLHTLSYFCHVVTYAHAHFFAPQKFESAVGVSCQLLFL
jgi:hypothetical protein